MRNAVGSLIVQLARAARRNVIAWAALFVALGGTGVAAVALSNGSITPVKLNARSIGGYVRGWVAVSARGRVTGSGGSVRVQADSGVAAGHYIVNWRPRPTSRCASVGSVSIAGGLVPGYVTTSSASTRGRGEQSVVQVYDAQGQPAALPFMLELVCATPH
ncbi:MAG: hypothetical protein ACRET5_15765 [Steroidobacteraceae bacterium]